MHLKAYDVSQGTNLVLLRYRCDDKADAKEIILRDSMIIIHIMLSVLLLADPRERSYMEKGLFLILIVETAYGTVRGKLWRSIGISPQKDIIWNARAQLAYSKSLGNLHSMIGTPFFETITFRTVCYWMDAWKTIVPRLWC